MISTEDCQFIEWMSQYYMSPIGQIAKLFCPQQLLLEPPMQSFYRLSTPQADINITAKRQQILDYLTKDRSHDDLKQQGFSLAIIRQLIQFGAIERYQKHHLHNSFTYSSLDQPLVSWNPSQEQAVQQLQKTVQSQSYCVTLLDGDTGSGKTDVYFEAVAETIRIGKKVLVLLPEISLSGQWKDRFIQRFGEAPFLWHSRCTAYQKRHVYWSLLQGNFAVLAGARSALMLPMHDVGLIIIDEEHDSGFKQQDDIAYHARDMAILRAKFWNIPIVLVSATPSLESFYHAKNGKYHHLKIESRTPEPCYHLVDMKHNILPHDRWISDPLNQGVTEALARQEQSFLFLNKRGYAPLLLCRDCGYRLHCPFCTAWMVYHQRHARIQCHHCGHHETKPEHCPQCHNDGWTSCGLGVERLLEEAKILWPEARILSLSSDDPNGYIKESIDRLTQGDIDIVISTQILAKGFHFPLMTLVGIIDADSSTHIDLKQNEHMYQLLRQVAGRAGREKSGYIVIQSYNPESALIQALVNQDRDQFYAIELQQRQNTRTPPFTRLAIVRFQSKKERVLQELLPQIKSCCPQNPDITVLGPAPALMYRLNETYRYQFLLSGAARHLQHYIAQWQQSWKLPNSIKVVIDIDPHRMV